MVNQNDRYPDFPKLECSACAEQFEVPRRWVPIKNLGEQIIIDWRSAELLMKTHHELHNTDLVQGVEDWLRANT